MRELWGCCLLEWRNQDFKILLDAMGKLREVLDARSLLGDFEIARQVNLPLGPFTVERLCKEEEFGILSSELYGRNIQAYNCYTCQLFLRFKREISILAVPRILNTTWSFPKIPNEVRSLPKKSEDFLSLSTSINASSLPVLFPSKIRDHEEGIVIYSFYTLAGINCKLINSIGRGWVLLS